MAKITKDQVNKINAKCKNGFTLSLYTASYCRLSGRKTYFVNS